MIPLSRPSIGAEEAEAAARVIRSGWLAQGPAVAALEDEFADYLDADDPPHVVAVSSGTAALHLALLASGVDYCATVACPSYTFVATANAILHRGARASLRDIDPVTFNLDPACINPRFDRFIIAVHQVGLPADMDAIRARVPKAKIIEDAACAIGARYPDGRRVGTRPDTIATFSLHGSKSVVAGEGGLVVTRDADTAGRVRRLRQHGVDIAAEARGNAEAESYVELGYNYRMTDVQAAIARVQLAKADDIVFVRRERAWAYSRALEDVCAVPNPSPGSRALAGHAFQRYLIRVRTNAIRERVVAALQAADISCRRGLQCIHRQPYWRWVTPALPVTEAVADTTIQLPLWADMPEADQARVIEVVRGALA